ncbi:MAG TPA: carbon-nitrogen hydrolase family protein [Ornithinimicrobium sp.]|uniref:carbon-nitrogen hydrolase family protein n=1 Tax=Ornithinimicrobium sp. TaxID=1977084 RepID=UPI002B45ABB3|nr:carbon-nitrogen hydrolase family protein [Ornithinimicrobium sp.]HKJ11180.1 carbon-nitrogen hydrolase family protein [Ornithinimicrobium sp.]
MTDSAALQLAVGQFSPTEDVAGNLDVIDGLVARAATAGAHLLVLPEYSVFTAPKMDDRFVKSAQPLDGEPVSRIARVAQHQGVAVIVGVNEPAGDGRIHNALVALRDGEVAAVYRKVHLYDAFGFSESDRVEAADPGEPELLEIGGFQVGMQTCYDLRFPEVSRTLVDAGADVLALPAQWVPGPLKEFHWNTLLRARAVENTAFVAAAGQAPPTGVGNSVILDPMGVAMTSIGEDSGIALAALERDRLDHVRQVNPALSLRRYAVVAAR